MKTYNGIFFLIATLVLSSCQKEESIANNTFDGREIYKATLGINELHWLPDGKHIIFIEFAQRALKKINIETKSVQNLNIQQGYVCDRIFVSNEIPDRFFYLAVKNDGNGIFIRKLFSYNLQTNLSTVLKDNAPSDLKMEIITNPATDVYLIKGNWIAISGDSVEFINLETGQSEFIPIPGDIKTFSPDGNQLLFYSREPNYQSPFKRKLVYDLSTRTVVPLQANVFSPIIWNKTGLYGFQFSYDNGGLFTIPNMVLTNYENGTVLDTIRNIIGGPWSANQETQIIAITFEEDGPSLYYPVLVAFDCNTFITREVFRMEKTQYSITVDPLNPKLFSISNDQEKIAYTTKGSYLRINTL